MKLCKTTLPLSALCTFALVAACAAPGPQHEQTPAGGAKQPGKDAPMDAGMPKPAPEHAMLQQLIGNWDATVSVMMPGEPPMVSSATAVYRAVGETWVASDFVGEMAGMPFIGHGIDGYDTLKKKFVSTWADSLSTEFLILEGTHDAAAHSTAMTGKGHDMEGKPVKYRTVSDMKDNDSMTFHMYMTGADGNEMETLKIDYKRRK